MPNDEVELDRLDMKHHEITLLLDGKLFTAPLDASALHHVLDIGTGTGIWASKCIYFVFVPYPSNRVEDGSSNSHSEDGMCHNCVQVGTFTVSH